MGCAIRLAHLRETHEDAMTRLREATSGAADSLCLVQRDGVPESARARTALLLQEMQED